MDRFVLLALVTIAGVLTLVLCAKAKALCTYWGLIDVPDARKQHGKATPLMGGIVLLIAFVPASLVLSLLWASERWLPSLGIWLAGVTAMTVVGLADDRHSLSPRARLFISFLIFGSAAAIDPTFNVRVLDFEHPHYSLGLGSWWSAIIFTVICSVGLINAVNMADGKNGLVIGLALGWLALLAMRAPEALGPAMLTLAVVLAVLFVFNAKGLLFLGDGGAYGLAGCIGLLAIMIYNTPGSHGLRAVSAEELTLLFSVPVLDSFRLTFIRLRRGQSPMAPDRDHFHHFLQMRFGWPGGLIVYLLAALTPAFLLMNFA
jgi:UDP-GlcNAc:undecaprenyl-phosphate/decaprenyl-phosphate GlcNAc-1-phosphate transferase